MSFKANQSKAAIGVQNMSNNIYERGYIPTNIAGTIGNYGSSVQSMPNSTDMFNEWMQNNTSSALGNTGNGVLLFTFAQGTLNQLITAPVSYRGR